MRKALQDPTWQRQSEARLVLSLLPPRGEGCWWTPEQVEYIKAVGMRDVIEPELAKLDESFRKFGRVPGIRVTVPRRTPTHVPPVPTESDTEIPNETTFACCGETIRHDDAPTYCVICGATAP